MTSRHNATALPAPARGFIADNICLAPLPIPPAGPDAAIFQAWADYKARLEAYEATPEEILIETDGMEEQLAEQITEAEFRLLALPAATLDGLAMKPRMRLLGETLTGDQHKAVMNGRLPSMSSLTNIGARETLGVLLDIERMIKRPVPLSLAGRNVLAAE